MNPCFRVFQHFYQIFYTKQLFAKTFPTLFFIICSSFSLLGPHTFYSLNFTNYLSLIFLSHPLSLPSPLGLPLFPLPLPLPPPPFFGLILPVHCMLLRVRPTIYLYLSIPLQMQPLLDQSSISYKYKEKPIIIWDWNVRNNTGCPDFYRVQLAILYANRVSC